MYYKKNCTWMDECIMDVIECLESDHGQIGQFNNIVRYINVLSKVYIFEFFYLIIWPLPGKHIDQAVFLWAWRSGQVSPAQTPPRPAPQPAPAATHQNDGNPILPTTGTEAPFYKFRDLCQYFTRIAGRMATRGVWCSLSTEVLLACTLQLY